MPEPVRDSSFPLTLGRDLRVYSGTVSPEDTVVAVIHGTSLMRVPISSFAPQAIKTGDGAPENPSDPGTAGSVTWSADGFYSYLDGTWGLSPRVTTHWEDYSDDVRFLIVNKDQNLSAKEQAQGRKNLDVVSATAEKEGLVQLKETLTESDTGTLVPTVYAVVQFVKSYNPGGGTTTVPHATTSVYGTVKLATSIHPSDSGIPTAVMVYNYIQSNLGSGGGGGGGSSVSHATTSTYGTVRLATVIADSNQDVTTSELVFNYVKDQLQDIGGSSGAVAHATTSSYGTVQLASAITSGNSNVPTAGQVYDFVMSHQGAGGGSSGTVPDATTSQKGIVQLASSITTPGNVVPTASMVKAYVDSHSAGGDLQDATTSQKGVVQLASSMDATGDVVPTAATIKAWVQSQISGSSSGGSGGDKISDYQGQISIKGPSGEAILVYNSSRHELTVGKGVIITGVNGSTPVVKVNNTTEIS